MQQLPAFVSVQTFICLFIVKHGNFLVSLLLVYDLIFFIITLKSFQKYKRSIKNYDYMTNQHLTVTSKHENVTLLPSFLLKGAGKGNCRNITTPATSGIISIINLLWRRCLIMLSLIILWDKSLHAQMLSKIDEAQKTLVNYICRHEGDFQP